MAWDSYALAAAVLYQMDFASPMAHKNVVCEIVSSADAEGRRWLLAVLYDELARFVSVTFHLAARSHVRCRKEWEDRAGKLGAKFNVNEAAKTLNENILRKVWFSSSVSAPVCTSPSSGTDVARHDLQKSTEAAVGGTRCDSVQAVRRRLG